MVIERVSGQPLDVFRREHLLEPLGMRDTHFYLPRDKVDRLTVVYSATPDGIERAPDPGQMEGQGAYLDGPRKSFSGGAGFLSTASDLWPIPADDAERWHAQRRPHPHAEDG